MNIDISIPKHSEIVAQQGEERDDKEFDWKSEFEFVDKEMVKSIEVVQEINRNHCRGKIFTLEGDLFELDCSVQEGIKVENSSQEEHIGKVFESLENLLMKVSPLYVDNFCNLGG